MKKNKPRQHPINHIGRVQRAVVKDCITGGTDDITQLCASMNLSHFKHRKDFRYTHKSILPYLIKIVRKKYKWHEEISSMRSYKEWVKVYKLNRIRNYKDIVEAIKIAPSTIPLPATKQEKDHLKIVQQRLKEREGKKNEW